MNVRAYRATGACITAVRRMLGFQIRVSGAESLPDRPTLFVANHFTRLETMLVPYVIFQAAGRPVRALTA